MFFNPPQTPVVVGRQFRFFAPGRIFGFDLAYCRKRDGVPVLGYNFSDMSDLFVLEPVDETCTQEEKLELDEIIRFHAGTAEVH